MPAPYSPTDAIVYGWRKLTQNLGPFIVMGVLILVIGVLISFGTNLIATGSLLAADAPTDPDTGLPEENLASTFIQLAGSLVTGAVSWFLTLVLLRGALDVVDTGRTDLGVMFTRIPWGQALVAGILVLLASMGGLLLCFVGVIPVLFFLYYTNVAVLDGASGTDALGASFRFVKDNVGDVFVFALLAIVITAVAACCTLGLASIVTTPMFAIAVAYTWRNLQGRPVAA